MCRSSLVGHKYCIFRDNVLLIKLPLSSWKKKCAHCQTFLPHFCYVRRINHSQGVNFLSSLSVFDPKPLPHITVTKLFISVINQLDVQNVCFTISLFHASTCFEHMCSSSGGQNCITQPLVSSHLLVWWYQRLCNSILTSWRWAHMLETCRGMKYTCCKTKILYIKLVNYWDKYTEMYCQQNVKIIKLVRSFSQTYFQYIPS